jgi:hypothetical protein
VSANTTPANMLAKTLRREIFIRSPPSPSQNWRARLKQQRARGEQSPIRTLNRGCVKARFLWQVGRAGGLAARLRRVEAALTNRLGVDLGSMRAAFDGLHGRGGIGGMRAGACLRHSCVSQLETRRHPPGLLADPCHASRGSDNSHTPRKEPSREPYSLGRPKGAQ